jgi:hypothetical protein
MSGKPSKQHSNSEKFFETIDVDWDSIVKANPILKDKNLKNKMKAWEALSAEGEKHGLKSHSAELAKFIADGMKKLGLAESLSADGDNHGLKIKKFFVKDLTGRGYSTEVEGNRILDLYDQDTFEDSFEDFKDWVESSEVGDEIKLTSMKIIRIS